MAHPTINIISQPDSGCVQSAYNCVEYCFESTDFKQTSGTKATFDIFKNPIIAGYAPGVVFEIAGQTFTSGTVNTYNEINTVAPLTALEFAQNFQEAFETNSYLYSNFTFEIIADVLIATARENGELENFTFSVVGTPNPPTINNTNGTPDVYRDNYRLVIEIWQHIPNVPALEFDQQVSKEAYIPDADGNFCINIGEKVASLLETRIIFDENLFQSCFDDLTNSATFFLRYGESYSDGLSECDVSLRHFESTDEIVVMNSAFQRNEAEAKIQHVCETNYLTNAPQFTKVTECSEFLLWINLDGVLPEPPSTIQIRPFFEITYTDGSTSQHTGAQCLYSSLQSSQMKIFPVGATQINFFADPLKTVDFYECRVEVLDTSGPVTTYVGSQFFQRVDCCVSDVELYFLNEFGAYDTILFSQVDSIDISQTSSIFESYLDCDESALNGGQTLIDINAQDVFSVTSLFPDNYQARRWLREFLTSPLKFVRTTIEGEEILSKIIVTPNVQYKNVDDNFILIRFQYTLNEFINLQKN